MTLHCISPLDYVDVSMNNSTDSTIPIQRGASLHLVRPGPEGEEASDAALSGKPVATSSLFFNYPACVGSTPAGRWAHSACSVGTWLLVYGGIGSSLFDDLWVMDTDTFRWRSVAPRGSTRDRPEKVMAHAAAATESSMWLFGGQQGRSFLSKLFKLDLESLTWSRVISTSLPSARAGHQMASAGSSIYLFGGQGKKLLNDIHLMDPRTGDFVEVQANGRLPIPRRGMSFVFDGREQLISFGGTHAGGIDAALSVFSIPRQEWTQPKQLGEAPTARTNHGSALICPGQVLIFGGCDAAGNFFNDAYILDTGTFTWHRPRVLNAAPAPRYHHSCCCVNGRVFLYGGINSKQVFDGMVVIETKVASEISHIADELHTLVSVGGRAGVHDSPVVRDMMTTQLADLLLKRNLQEMNAHTAQQAETAERLLAKEREAVEALRRENMQLRLMFSESEGMAARAREATRAAEARASKSTAALCELRATHESVLARMAESEAEVESTRKMHQDLLKELGIVASRYSRLQLQLQGAPSTAGKSKQHSRPGKTASASQQQWAMQFSAPLATVQREPIAHASLSSVSSTGPTSASSGASRGAMDNMVSVLADFERQSSELQSRVELLTERLEQQQQQQHLQKAEIGRQQRWLAADADELRRLPLAELQDAEPRLHAALCAVREAALQHRIAEVEHRAVLEQQQCALCMERPRGIVFNCGHQSCDCCGEKLATCPFCRSPVTTRIRMFNS